MKVYIIIAHTGQEIIDNTLEAQERIAAMEYLEERQRRKTKWMVEERRKRARNPLCRIASFCGIV